MMLPAPAGLALPLAAPQTQTFKAPYFDYHALAPEIVLTGVIVLVLIVDLVVDETHKHLVTQLAGIDNSSSAMKMLIRSLELAMITIPSRDDSMRKAYSPS